MQGVGWFLAIILGGLAGWIAEKVTGSNMGIIAHVILGIVGAFVSTYLVQAVGWYRPDGEAPHPGPHEPLDLTVEAVRHVQQDRRRVAGP